MDSFLPQVILVLGVVSLILAQTIGDSKLENNHSEIASNRVECSACSALCKAPDVPSHCNCSCDISDYGDEFDEFSPDFEEFLEDNTICEQELIASLKLAAEIGYEVLNPKEQRSNSSRPFNQSDELFSLSHLVQNLIGMQFLKSAVVVSLLPNNISDISEIKKYFNDIRSTAVRKIKTMFWEWKVKGKYQNNHESYDDYNGHFELNYPPFYSKENDCDSAIGEYEDFAHTDSLFRNVTQLYRYFRSGRLHKTDRTQNEEYHIADEELDYPPYSINEYEVGDGNIMYPNLSVKLKKHLIQQVKCLKKKVGFNTPIEHVSSRFNVNYSNKATTNCTKSNFNDKDITSRLFSEMFIKIVNGVYGQIESNNGSPYRNRFLTQISAFLEEIQSETENVTDLLSRKDVFYFWKQFTSFQHERYNEINSIDLDQLVNYFQIENHHFQDDLMNWWKFVHHVYNEEDNSSNDGTKFYNIKHIEIVSYCIERRYINNRKTKNDQKCNLYEEFLLSSIEEIRKKNKTHLLSELFFDGISHFLDMQIEISQYFDFSFMLTYFKENDHVDYKEDHTKNDFNQEFYEDDSYIDGYDNTYNYEDEEYKGSYQQRIRNPSDASKDKSNSDQPQNNPTNNEYDLKKFGCDPNDLKRSDCQPSGLKSSATDLNAGLHNSYASYDFYEYENHPRQEDVDEYQFISILSNPILAEPGELPGKSLKVFQYVLGRSETYLFFEMMRERLKYKIPKLKQAHERIKDLLNSTATEEARHNISVCASSIKSSLTQQLFNFATEIKNETHLENIAKPQNATEALENCFQLFNLTKHMYIDRYFHLIKENIVNLTSIFSYYIEVLEIKNISSCPKNDTNQLDHFELTYELSKNLRTCLKSRNDVDHPLYNGSVNNNFLERPDNHIFSPPPNTNENATAHILFPEIVTGLESSKEVYVRDLSRDGFQIVTLPDKHIGFLEYRISDDIRPDFSYSDRSNKQGILKDDRTEPEQLCKHTKGWDCVGREQYLFGDEIIRFMLNSSSDVGLIQFKVITGSKKDLVIGILFLPLISKSPSGVVDNYPSWLDRLILSAPDISFVVELGEKILISIELFYEKKLSIVRGLQEMRELSSNENPEIIQRFLNLYNQRIFNNNVTLHFENQFLENFDIETSTAIVSKNIFKIMVKENIFVRLKATNITRPNLFHFGVRHLNRNFERDILFLVKSPVQTLYNGKALKLPAISDVPYDLRSNIGFKSGSLAKKLVLDNLRHRKLGLVVVSFPNGKLGQWQAGYRNNTEWRNIISFVSFSGVVRSGVVSLLLMPHVRIRFQPNTPNTFWKISDTRNHPRISVKVWDSEVIDSLSFTRSDEIHSTLLCPSPVHDCNDSLSGHGDVLSGFTVNLDVERRGCDGKSSSLAEFDLCGVCGGDGYSCVDCNGDINGSAIIDHCGECTEGNTNKTYGFKLDCANDCDQNNYLDDCGFCQNREKPVDTRDCAGVCFGKAKLHPCGGCVVPNFVSQRVSDERIVKDKCGVCGGDGMSCVGCDGVVNSTFVGLCGLCLHPDDAASISDCDDNSLRPQLFPLRKVIILDSKHKTKYPFDVILYGNLDDFTQANCNISVGLFVYESVSDVLSKDDMLKNIKGNKHITKNVDFLDDSIRFLHLVVAFPSTFYENVKADHFSAKCQFNLTEEFVVNSHPFEIHTSDWPTLSRMNLEYTLIDQDYFELEITGEYFDRDLDLYCLLSHSTGGIQIHYSTAAKVINNSLIECNVTKSYNEPGIVKVFVVTALEKLGYSNYFEKRENYFELELRQPSIKLTSAKLTTKLKTIRIKFDQAVKLNTNARDCIGVFDDKSLNALGRNPLCFANRYGNVIVHLGEDLATTGIPNQSIRNALISPIANLVLLQGAIVGINSDRIYDTFQRISFAVDMPDVLEKPVINIKMPKTVGTCDSVYIKYVLDGSIGPWGVSFEWTVRTLDNSTDSNTQEFENMLNFDHNANQVIDLGKAPVYIESQYIFSVVVRNYFGLASEVVSNEVEFLASTAVVRTTIVGSSLITIKADQNLRIKSSTKLLMPKCDNEAVTAITSASQISYLWQVSYSKGNEISLNDYLDSFLDDGQEFGPKLLIPSGVLNHGVVYTFTVNAAVHDENFVIFGTSHDSVDVYLLSSSPVAIITGVPDDGLVDSGQFVVLNGLDSYNPGKEDSKLEFNWQCADIDGFPCVLNDLENNKLVRAEVLFPQYLLEPGSIKIPAHLFQSNKYNFTLFVRYGDKEASRSVLVTITTIPPTLPRLGFAEKPNEDEVFAVEKIIRFKAFVTGTGSYHGLLEWISIEDDVFSKINLDESSKTEIHRDIFFNGPETFQIPLVLKRKSLEPARKYKIRLALYSLNKGDDTDVFASHVDVVFSTSSQLEGGSLHISPTIGEAMTTDFTISTSAWIDPSASDLDDAVPLVYRFGYYKQIEGTTKEKISWLNEFSDTSQSSFKFPPGYGEENKLKVVVAVSRVGEENKRNFAFLTDSVTVYPLTLVENELDEVINSSLTLINEAIVTGNPGHAAALISTLVDSLPHIDETSFIREAEQFVDTLPTSAKTENDAQEILQAANDVFSRVGATEESADKVSYVIANIMNLFTDGRRRRKRQTDGQTTTLELTIEMGEDVLSTYDALLRLGEPDSRSYISTRDRFDADVSDMLGLFCANIAYSEPAIDVSTFDSILTVAKHSSVTDLSIVGNQIYQVYLSNEAGQKYDRWNCNGITECNGACIGTGLFRHNVVTWYDLDKNNRVSDIVVVSIRNPETGSPAENRLTSNWTDTVTIEFREIQFQNTLEQPSHIECRRYDNFAWWSEDCLTRLNGNEVSCICSIGHGYFAVFSVVSTETTTSPARITSNVGYSSTSNSCQHPKQLVTDCPSLCVPHCEDLSLLPPCKELCVPYQSCICPPDYMDKHGECVPRKVCIDDEDGVLDYIKDNKWIFIVVGCLVGLVVAILIGVVGICIMNKMAKQKDVVRSITTQPVQIDCCRDASGRSPLASAPYLNHSHALPSYFPPPGYVAETSNWNSVAGKTDV